MSQSEWVGERSRRWLAELAAREAQLRPVSDALFNAAGLRPGDSVLDVGCGPGTTTEPAFRAVQPGGRVTGLDVSPEMIEAAQERFGRLRIGWLLADVVTAELPEQAYDVVLSRFGLMFFSDPLAAFTRLAAATRPGGRLCAAVWRRRTESPFFSVPYDAVLADLLRGGAEVVEPDPDGNSCSLGAVAPTTELLTAAGWSDVHWDARDDRLYAGGAGSVVEAAALAPEIGPVHALLEGRSDVERRSAVRALVEAFTPWFDGRGVALPGGFWILTARRRRPSEVVARPPGHLLQGQAVTVRVGEAGIADAAADVLDVADLDPASSQLGARRLDVGDDEVQALDRTRRHRVQGGHSRADDNGAGRAGRGQLYDPQAGKRPDVDVECETELLGVERLGPVHVADRHRDELELHVHGDS